MVLGSIVIITKHTFKKAFSLKNDSMKKENIPWEAISSYLAGDKNNEHLQTIREWLDTSEEHPLILSEIINTWQLTRKQNSFYKPDVDILWNKLLLRIGIRTGREFNLQPVIKWISAAAIILIVFISGIWLGKSSWNGNANLVYSSVMSPSGNKTRIVLPDSTIVWLNSGAEIRYPAAFKKNSREVFVTGECYFDVTKDHKRQFIVHCNKFDVKVFGTSFNIRDNKMYNQTEVALIEGNVQVFSKANHQLTTLTPGEQFAYNGEKGIVRKIENTAALIAWKNNMLIFEDEPFESVIQSLESWYGVEFQVDERIKSKHRYTFRLKTESLREVLDMISVITPIDYVIEGEKVSVKYK